MVGKSRFHHFYERDSLINITPSRNRFRESANSNTTVLGIRAAHVRSPWIMGRPRLVSPQKRGVDMAANDDMTWINNHFLDHVVMLIPSDSTNTKPTGAQVSHDQIASLQITAATLPIPGPVTLS